MSYDVDFVSSKFILLISKLKGKVDLEMVFIKNS